MLKPFKVRNTNAKCHKTPTFLLHVTEPPLVENLTITFKWFQLF